MNATESRGLSLEKCDGILEVEARSSQSYSAGYKVILGQIVYFMIKASLALGAPAKPFGFCAHKACPQCQLCPRG